MKRIFVILAALAACATLFTGSAEAQAVRTFVSGNGSDANPCTRIAPCRTFAGALAVTSDGGEITVLDPAGYQPVTINKSVSIVNDGVGEAATTGITINAGASAIVNLRGITVNGGGAGSPVNGIVGVSGGTLNIQNCVIHGFQQSGIDFAPASAANLNVSDTIVANNGGSGIGVFPAGGATTASFVRVQAIGNSIGFNLFTSIASTVAATAADSTASGNSTGFQASGAKFTIVSSQAVGNGTGVSAVSSPTPPTQMFLAHSTLSGNGTGYAGTINTFGNNFIADTNNSGTLTPFPQQ